jgi:putative DNA primase/helicase
MSKDAITRNLATLNVLWDAAPLQVDRRGAPPYRPTWRKADHCPASPRADPARLLRKVWRPGARHRLSGPFPAVVARVDPRQSTIQGKAPCLLACLGCLSPQDERTLLEKDAPLDDEGRLDPPMMKLAPDAKRSWIAFHDGVESQLRAGGELHDVRDVASKIADNAARLGALFQLFEDGTAIMSDDNMTRAIRIAAWHLTESRRFFGELAIPEDEANVMRLDAWLAEHCRRHQTSHITRRDLQRNVTPTRLRNKKPLDDALKALAEAGRIRLIRAGRNQTVIDRNPALLAMTS